MIPGIPTLYKGVQYRSRLEARWAAFFDLLKWPYQYEPFDLEGWIPDFILTPTGRPPILVEVKPVTEFPDDVAAEIDATSWDKEVLIVGCILIEGSWTDLGPGWLRETFVFVDDDWNERQVKTWDTTEFVDAGPSIGFCHSSGGFTDRITGYYDGGSELKRPDAIRRLWDQAGNVTQWKGKKSKVNW